MITNLAKDNNKKGTESEYKPSESEKLAISQILKDFETADQQRNASYKEFNDMTLMQRKKQDNESWNQYVSSQSSTPEDAWRSRAVRPVTRNKGVAILGHVSNRIITPKVFAQNNKQFEDRNAASVMGDLMEWTNYHAKYEKRLMYAMTAAMYNPVSFMHTQYSEVERTIKTTRNADGTYNTKKVLDDEYSGIQDTPVPMEEIYIANFYEPELQRQPFLIWRKIVDYTVVKAMFSSSENFQFVTPGKKTMFSDDGEWQNYADRDLEGREVEIVRYYNRAEDVELVLVNGVLVTDAEQPNPRQDKKYPFSCMGYELIDERFFYFKSLAYKLSSDEDVLNTLYRMVIDGTYLQVMPPTLTFGDVDMGSGIMVPGMNTAIDGVEDPKNAFHVVNTQNQLTAGHMMIDKVESSLSESSTDGSQSGIGTSSRQTAYEIESLQENAKKMLGLFARMISFMVRDLGVLRMSDITQYLTTADIAKVSGDSINHKSFLLPEKMVDGKLMSKKIDFSMDFGEASTQEEQLMESARVYEEESMYSKTKIVKVNPKAFRELKYLVFVDAEPALTRSEALERQQNLELYGIMASDPETFDKEIAAREVLLPSFNATKLDPNKYLLDPEQKNKVSQQEMEGERLPEDLVMEK